MKKVLMSIVALAIVSMLAACWPAEIGVETTFNADGSGTRVFVIDIMDDTLSTTPITNPDDPEGTEGKGAVLNDKHVDGGVIAIQAWLEDNAPDFMTVHDATVDGYHRYFKLSFDFESFDDFLAKYELLVNLSPNLSWDDFDASELPTLTSSTSGSVKTMTFTESKVMVEASLDWAISGIYEDLYNEADLAGFVTKADIWVLANVKVTLGDGEFKEERHYDPDAEEGDDAGNTGKVIFVESQEFEATGEFEVPTTNIWLIVGIVAGVLVLGGLGAFFLIKKRG